MIREVNKVMSYKLVKLVSAQADTDVEYANGQGTYKGAKIVYEAFGKLTSKGIAAKALAATPGLEPKIRELEGDSGKEVTLVEERVERNGKTYVNIKDILPASAATSAPSQASSGGHSSGGFTRKGGNTKDTARIARSTAVTAAAAIATTGDEVLELAEKFAAFIVAPLSIDSSGVEVSKDTTSKPDEGSSDASLPF